MKPEIIALIGVLASSTLSGVIAFLVVAYKSKVDRAHFAQQLDIQIAINRREMLRERSERKIDIAYKYAELNQMDTEVAKTFLNEVAKETAIGFLYLNDDDTKSKIWIRNDANILVGRGQHCDVCLSNTFVSREHCVVHAQDHKVYIVPLNPTNPMVVDDQTVQAKFEIRDGSALCIGPYEFIYFEL